MIRFYLFNWPFYQLCKLWNPFGISDRRTGATIKDIFSKRASRKRSAAERQRRLQEGEDEKKWFSCKTIRSLDLSEGSN